MAWVTPDGAFKITPGVTKVVVEEWVPTLPSVIKGATFRGRKVGGGAWMPYACMTMTELGQFTDLADLEEVA
jgi:hypothetical protein